MNKKEIINIIQEGISSLSKITVGLDNEGNIGEKIYNDLDMLNVSILFTHILGNISTDYLIKKGADNNILKSLGTEMGKNIHQTIELSSGLNMKEVAKKYFNNGNNNDGMQEVQK